MGNNYAPFSLRISEDLMEKLKKSAKKNSRSVNKEIEYIIKLHLEKKNGTNSSNVIHSHKS